MTPIPSMIFYGPETPTLYGSMNESAINFYLNFSCSPCVTAYNHRKSPCDGDNLCLKNIQPEEVLAKALEILEGSKVQGSGRPPVKKMASQIEKKTPKKRISNVE
jgi:hypothetical protein